MIIPDANLLIYAYNETSRFHGRARVWWEQTLSRPEAVGLPWAVSLAFLRIMTSPRVFEDPMDVGTAARHVRSWLGRPQVVVLTEGERHADLVLRYLEELGCAGNLTTDAHLAALAVDQRAVLYTADTDFGRFAELTWRNPLE